ncbi:hypothetical protein FRC06_004668 [Ceratobasidium sp. 370]|nr:hypothetical protein FRC06_004668 [Ceratobasidium sp. 370]
MSTGTGRVDCVNHYNDYLDTQKKDTCHVCLSTGAVVGLSFHAQMGLISLVSLLILLGIIARNYRRMCIRRPNGGWRLFRGNVDILMVPIHMLHHCMRADHKFPAQLNLIIADILMSFGAISDVYWAHHRQVFCGSYCNAQGVLQTMGETAAALSTLAVAIYTFLAIYRDHHPKYRPWKCVAVVSAIWLWVLLWAVIPLGIKRGAGLDKSGSVQDFYTPTPWWCWINGRYMPERVIAEYLWLWVAGIGSIALYVPSYFKVRNQKDASGPNEQYRHSTLGPQLESDTQSVASSMHGNDEAVKMLWYPLVYTLCVLPLSIIRWAGFVHPALLTSSHILAPSMIFSSIFNLMGLFNVGLTLWTRPAILLINCDEELNVVYLEHMTPGVSRVSSRASAGLNHRGGNRHEKLTADETDTNQRPANRFGGAAVSLTREF